MFARYSVLGCIAAEASHHHPALGLPGGAALLGLFAVDPGVQSQGVGGRLLRGCLLAIREKWPTYDQAILWVLEARADIQRWYEKLGFQCHHDETKPFVLPQNARQPDLRFRVYRRNLQGDLWK